MYYLFLFPGLSVNSPMENHKINSFNQMLRERTQLMASRIYELLSNKKGPVLSRSPIQQLVRCSTSVAANWRSATRSRSDAEFYSKICIVTEECDETLFWLDFLIRVKVISPAETSDIRAEVEELVKLYTAIKLKMKNKLEI